MHCGDERDRAAGGYSFTRLATERAGRGIRGDLASAERAWAAAMTLLPSQHAEFIRNVRRRLGRRPTNGDVQQAIAAELSLNGLPAFLCEGATNK